MPLRDSLQLQAIKPDDAPAWVASVIVPFFEQGSDHRALRHWGPHLEVGRTWAVADRGRIVANCCVFSREVTLPAGPSGVCPSIPMAAISGVGVHPTHRRRGLLTSMMETMLGDAIERGEAMAGLLASEGTIYGRFGFGVGSLNAEYVLHPRECAFARSPQVAPVELIDVARAPQVLPELHEAARCRRPGDVSRSAAAWGDEWQDPVERRDGATAAYRAVTAGGFVSYRVKRHSVDRIEANKVIVHDLYGATPQVEAGLWRFLLELDLVGEVIAWRRPVDDALRWWLADPRQLRTTAVVDMLWIRPLDVPAALAARGYASEGRLVFEVAPATLAPPGGDPASGSFVLDAGPDGASCRRARTGEAPELILGVADLGSVLLGGVSPSGLAAAGRIEEVRPGALALADALFRSPVAPFTGTNF